MGISKAGRLSPTVSTELTPRSKTTSVPAPATAGKLPSSGQTEIADTLERSKRRAGVSAKSIFAPSVRSSKRATHGALGALSSSQIIDRYDLYRNPRAHEQRNHANLAADPKVGPPTAEAEKMAARLSAAGVQVTPADAQYILTVLAAGREADPLTGLLRQLGAPEDVAGDWAVELRKADRCSGTFDAAHGTLLDKYRATMIEPLVARLEQPPDLALLANPDAIAQADGALAARRPHAGLLPPDELAALAADPELAAPLQVLTDAYQQAWAAALYHTNAELLVDALAVFPAGGALELQRSAKSKGDSYIDHVARAIEVHIGLLTFGAGGDTSVARLAGPTDAASLVRSLTLLREIAIQDPARAQAIGQRFFPAFAQASAVLGPPKL